MKRYARKAIAHLLKVFYIFPIKKNKIYLINFNGTAYGFDARAFAEYVDKHYSGQYEFVWEVKNKEKFNGQSNITEMRYVERNSVRSIIDAMTAGITICNFVPRSYIPFRKKQIIINTWHGNPVKKVGKYAPNYNKDAYSTASCFISHSEQYSKLVLEDSFEYSGEILKCGAPRNDIFFGEERNKKVCEIKQALSLQGKKVALYAPTFRGNYQQEECEIDAKSIAGTLEAKFGGEWVILYRLHPMVANNAKENKYIKDVSRYPDMQDLLLISDLLITDYSSSMWDFSLQRKPVILYANDIRSYENDRGLYFPITDLPFLLSTSNDELEMCIKEYDEEKYLANLERYFLTVGNYEDGKSNESIMVYINRKQRKWFGK